MNEIKLSGKALLTLFENIGGEPGLTRLLTRFYEKMSQDILIGYFFDGKDIRKIALMQKAFLMRAWGAAPSYSGKSPADAHKMLPQILSGHFDRRIVLLTETLREFNVKEKDIEIWVGFESKFRQAVVT